MALASISSSSRLRCSSSVWEHLAQWQPAWKVMNENQWRIFMGLQGQAAGSHIKG
jgi:hypothetical protein